MNRIYILLFLFASCNNKHRDLTIAASGIKKIFTQEVNDIGKIDTLYILVTPLTPRLINTMQSAEYMYTSTMLKKQKSSDSLKFETIADSIVYNSNKFDSVTVVYYRLAAMLTYISTDKSLKVAEKWFFINKDNRLMDKYQIVRKVSPYDNNELMTYPFSQLTEEDLNVLRNNSSFLKF